MEEIEARISSTVLGCPDPPVLAHFYREFLGWSTVHEQPGWVQIKPAEGGHGMAFQLEPSYARPAWPAGPGEQQMQAHLDIGVADLDAGVQRAESLGATQAAFQPQDDVRVLLDPAGHPFCLFARS